MSDNTVLRPEYRPPLQREALDLYKTVRHMCSDAAETWDESTALSYADELRRHARQIKARADAIYDGAVRRSARECRGKPVHLEPWERRAVEKVWREEADAEIAKAVSARLDSIAKLPPPAQ